MCLCAKKKKESKTFPKELVEYKKIREKIKPIPFVVSCKMEVLCWLFCGKGKKCKHENYETYPDSAIDGLNSDWINDSILATQRPSSRLIKEFELPKVFRELKILSIFNLEEPGEHAHCGDGIHADSGFSYYPEEFNSAGIKFFNFGWQDHSSTKIDFILKIMKSMDMCIARGERVAVHCHAGRGRTGLIICSYFIYKEGMTADEAIKLFKSKRSGALRGSGQKRSLKEFEKYLKETRKVFFEEPQFTLTELISRQIQINPIIKDKRDRHVPSLIREVFKYLRELIDSQKVDSDQICYSFFDLDDERIFHSKWSKLKEEEIEKIKNKYNETGELRASKVNDIRVLIQLVFDFLEGLKSPAISQNTLQFLNMVVKDGSEKPDSKDPDGVIRGNTYKTFVQKNLKKCEFYLLIAIKEFLYFLHTKVDMEQFQLEAIFFRFSTALLKLRSEVSSAFNGRSIDVSNLSLRENPNLTSMTIILSKWTVERRFRLTTVVESMLSYPMVNFAKKFYTSDAERRNSRFLSKSKDHLKSLNNHIDLAKRSPFSQAKSAFHKTDQKKKSTSKSKKNLSKLEKSNIEENGVIKTESGIEKDEESSYNLSESQGMMFEQLGGSMTNLDSAMRTLHRSKPLLSRMDTYDMASKEQLLRPKMVKKFKRLSVDKQKVVISYLKMLMNGAEMDFGTGVSSGSKFPPASFQTKSKFNLASGGGKNNTGERKKEDRGGAGLQKMNSIE